LFDLFYLRANNSVGELSDPGISNIGLPRIIDGNRVMWNHRFHELDITNQGLLPINGDHPDSK